MLSTTTLVESWYGGSTEEELDELEDEELLLEERDELEDDDELDDELDELELDELELEDRLELDELELELELELDDGFSRGSSCQFASSSSVHGQ